VEGHGRQIAALELGLDEVPCIRLDHLSEKQWREYAIRHNRTAELSQWDWSRLQEECAALSIEGQDFPELNFTFDDFSGGALILVEKVLGSNNAIDTMLVDEYYRIKAENAYTQEQISAKRKSLEGVLVPITARWNEEMLKEAGFRSVDCFWRYLNFAGWVAVK
jgi:hypothetical protein